jgi:aryl-alcohol dehydrogenase-like predicted oxidoreductase
MLEYRNLGRTGVKVSNACLGAMMFGGRTNAEDSAAIIERALDAGINFIEEVTGAALKRSGKRERVVLATKVHGKMGEDINAQGNTRRHIIQQCEESLRRLQTDWIDLYQLHRPQSDLPIDETLRALDDLIRAGKVRYIGTSTFGAWQLMESLWVAKELGLNRFVCEQPPYNLLDRRVERELLPMARTYGIAIIPWSPLGGGLLTGKYNRGEPPPPDSRFGQAGRNPGQQRRLNDRVFDVVEELEPIAHEKGVTLSQLSLAWVMQQPGVTSPILGPRTMEQFVDNLGAFDIEITEDDRKRIDEIIAPGTNVAPFYEADFGPHRYRVW